MRAKTKIFLLVIVAVLQMFTGNRCNIPETITTSEAEITLPSDTGSLFKHTKLYFVLVPGDTALFYGAHQCTMSTNGIIDTVISDSSYLRTITLQGRPLNFNDTLRFVFPQLYQQSSSFAAINENTVIRYMEKTDSATLQVAHEEKGAITYLDKNKQVVFPRTVLIGPYAQFVTDSTNIPTTNTWHASPLIKCPVASSQGKISFEGYRIAAKVIALSEPGSISYTVNGNDYDDGFFAKTYYAISGETIEDDKVVRVAGTVVVIRSYFKEIGLVDQETHISIQKIFSNGVIERQRERIYVARGPGPVKLFSENTDTLNIIK